MNIFLESDLSDLQVSQDEKNLSMQSLVPQTVLLGSLLEHLCYLHESDEEKANELFLGMLQ